MCLNVIYDKQTGASLECQSTAWIALELGNIIIFTHTSKVNCTIKVII